MGVKEVKETIRIVSADPKTNKQISDLVKSDGDCFGVGYSDNDDCKKCNILSELGDKRGPLWQFCKELVSGSSEPGKEEVKEEEVKEAVSPDGPVGPVGVEVETKKEEVKEEKEEGGDKEMPKGSNIELAKKMLAEGKTEEQVVAEIKEIYVKKGKSEDFAEKRAKIYLKLAKKS